MYLLKTRQITNAFVLSVTFAIVFAMYCGNIIDEKITDAIDSIQAMFVPQINFYGEHNSPYSY